METNKCPVCGRAVFGDAIHAKCAQTLVDARIVWYCLIAAAEAVLRAAVWVKEEETKNAEQNWVWRTP